MKNNAMTLPISFDELDDFLISHCDDPIDFCIPEGEELEMLNPAEETEPAETEKSAIALYYHKQLNEALNRFYSLMHQGYKRTKAGMR